MNPHHVARLVEDDLAQRERPGHHDHGGERETIRQLVADHLRRRAQRAEQRVLAVGRPARQHDAVHAHRGDGEDHQYRDVDVGHLQRNRLVQQTEEGRFGAERNDGKRGKRRAGRNHRCDDEEQRVGRLRPELLLEHQLDDVRERLQQALEADPVRPFAVLDIRADLALHPHHEGCRQHQHVEDDEDQPEVSRDLWIERHDSERATASAQRTKATEPENS